MTIGTTFQQNFQQRQEQQLSPAQFQALEMLTAPVLELQERIDQELALNPVLELDALPGELLAGDPVAGVTEAELRPDAEDRIDRDDGFAELAELADRWQDFGSGGSDESNPEAERRQDYYFNSLAADPAPAESLAEQLRWMEAPEPVKEAARHIAEALDERGYFVRTPAELAAEHGGDPADYEEALRQVRHFEPAGIAARDLAECLTLQLERRGEGDDILFELVEKHLDDIAHNRLPQVAKALNLTLPELQAYLERLKGLTTAPGRQLEDAAPGYVAPELKVRFRAGEPVITGHDRWLPRLRINPEYLEMYNDPTTPPATKAYLREKIMKAQELFGSLEFRSCTLRRITEALTVLQHDFFTGGPDQLKPLTMRQVADRLGVHETTVSRAVAGKYLDTPYGVMEFRKFFSGGYTNDSGEEVAASAIHSLIQELVDCEDPARPLSDDAIARELQQRGFPVARRTVAKYRGILGILPTNLRRKHV